MNNSGSDESGFRPLEDLQVAEFYLRVLFRALSSVPHMFTRRRFGIHHFRITTGLGIVLFWLYYSLTIERSFHEPFLVVFLVWLLMNVLHRIQAYRQDSRIDRVHSSYNGWPILCDFLPIREETAKDKLEPVFILLCSLVFIPLNAPFLLIFFAAAGFAGGIESCTSTQRWKARVRQMRDAEIEHQVLMDEFDEQTRF